MPDTSPILALPYILPSQAQKHVTHNEALRHLDAIVQLVVISANLTVPPAAPIPGERYIVGPGATGGWAGQDGTIAVADSGGWIFYGAQSGWRAEDLSTNSQIRFNGTEWIPADQIPDSLDQLGIGTSADATNRLAVAAPATLLTHEGAGHQLKINKAQDTDTASVLFQTGWSGRAEIGLAGSEDFSIKVSDDGTSFKQAIVLDRLTGASTAPGNPAFSAYSVGTWITVTTPHTDLVFNTAVLNRGNHYDTSTSTFTAPVAGLYGFLINGFLGSSTQGRVSFAKNGNTQVTQMQVLVGAVPLSFTVVLPLVKGDQVSCRTGNTNANLTYFQGHTMFSGWLIS